MLVYMTHPKHGRMPCYTPQEVEYNKNYGWSVETDGEREKITLDSIAKKKSGRPKKVEDGNRQ